MDWCSVYSTPQALPKYIYLSPPLIFPTTYNGIRAKNRPVWITSGLLHYVKWEHKRTEGYVIVSNDHSQIYIWSFFGVRGPFSRIKCKRENVKKGGARIIYIERCIKKNTAIEWSYWRASAMTKNLIVVLIKVVKLYLRTSIAYVYIQKAKWASIERWFWKSCIQFLISLWKLDTKLNVIKLFS